MFFGPVPFTFFPPLSKGARKQPMKPRACALAQITTREAGDVVVDGVNGVVIPPDDVDATAAAIQFLYDHPDLVRNYGMAGRELVVEQFTWDHFRDRVLQPTDWQWTEQLSRGACIRCDDVTVPSLSSMFLLVRAGYELVESSTRLYRVSILPSSASRPLGTYPPCSRPVSIAKSSPARSAPVWPPFGQEARGGRRLDP